MSKRNCLFCNSDLAGAPRGGYKFCNKQCRINYHGNRRKNSAHCVSCGSRLSKFKHKYCDDNCYRAYNRKSDYEKNCLYCGSEIKWNHNTGPKMKYCNKSCRDNYSIAKRKKEKTNTKCGICGKYLTRLQTGRGQKYCSYACSGISLRIAKGTTKVCVVCGSDFEPKVKIHQCCSDKCARIKAGQTKATKPRELIEKDCEICGTPFEYRYFGGANYPKYCGVCRPRLENDRSHRRRITTKYQALEKIIDLYIFDRDGWVCQLCGEPVYDKFSWPDPLSASLDHIIPISKGGEHTRSNVQLAHLGCNSRKWNRL